jgi:hypothetical protein
MLCEQLQPSTCSRALLAGTKNKVKSRHLVPRTFLTEEEVGIVESETDLVSLLADETVAEGLKG